LDREKTAIKSSDIEQELNEMVANPLKMPHVRVIYIGRFQNIQVSN
jgi:hypothetical protein